MKLSTTVPGPAPVYLGILGLGRIGRAMTVRAQAFGMTVIAYDPLIESDVFERAGVEQVVLRGSSEAIRFVSMHPPLTATPSTSSTRRPCA